MHSINQHIVTLQGIINNLSLRMNRLETLKSSEGLSKDEVKKLIAEHHVQGSLTKEEVKSMISDQVKPSLTKEEVKSMISDQVKPSLTKEEVKPSLTKKEVQDMLAETKKEIVSFIMETKKSCTMANQVAEQVEDQVENQDTPTVEIDVIDLQQNHIIENNDDDFIINMKEAPKATAPKKSRKKT